MKLRLPNRLKAAVIAAVTAVVYATLGTATFGAAAQAAVDPAAANAGDISQTMHVYILTGQSNAQGAVYASPASSAQLEQYQSGAIMWNSSLDKYSTSPVFAADNVTWRDVAPQLPIWGGNYSMGGEYGFASMMERLAGDENVTKANGERLEIGQLAVIKAALNGGGNQYWVKGNAAYEKMLEGMKNALQAAVGNGYQSISIDGLMYLQGESNDAAGAAATESRYKGYIANLTSDLSAWVEEQGLSDKISVAFDGNTVLGEPSRNPASTIEKQIATATSDGHVNTDGNGIGFVYARDLAKGSDNLHYTGESQLSIGARYAYALAVQQGYNVGTVRGSDSTKALDNAGAWWMEQLPATDAVVKWDVSSVAKTNTISSSLSVGGIVVEDPYQGQVNISGGTLHVGAQGIELKQGSLNVASAFVADAPQTWKVAGGRTLNLSNAGTTSNTISLINDSGSGTAHVSVNGATQDWNVTGDADLKVASAHAVTTAAGSSLGLGTVSGGELALDSLSLGANTTLSVGGAGTVGTLTVGSLTLGGDASVNMDFMGSTRYDKLTLSGMSGDGTVNFNFNVTKTGRGGSYTVVQGWNGTSFTYSGLEALEGATFAHDGNGNLVLTLAGSTGPAIVTDYTKAWPTGTQTAATLTTGAYDASAKGSNTLNTGTAQYFFGVGATCGTADVPIDNYAEIRDAGATWVSAAGSIYGSTAVTVVGDTAVKVTGDTASSGTTVYNAVNATVTGNVYVELDKAGATYDALNGTHNATINGRNTLVVRGGTVNGTVTGGSVSGGNRISGGTYVQIDDGTFKGVVAAGNSARSAVIDNGSHLVINGGTFSADVAGGNNGNGTINDGVQMVIDGGTFNANVAGGNNGVGTINGGVDMHISGGTFNGYVYGGNLWGSDSASAANSVINGDINMEISGGTFNNAGSKAVYATGYGHKVDGDVTLTLSGGTFASGYHLYTGGWNGASVTEGHKTTLVLQDIDSSNALATANINLRGTGSAAPELVFSHVTTAVAANFSGFTTLRVADESDAVLARNVANHTALLSALTGGITVEEGSNLTLLHPNSGPWDLTNRSFHLEEGGSLTKGGQFWTNIGTLTGSGTYHVANDVKGGGSQVSHISNFQGTIHIGRDKTVEMMNAGSSGVTFNVEKGGTAKIYAAAGSMGTLSGDGVVELKGTLTNGTGTNHSSFAFDNWSGTVKLTNSAVAASGSQGLRLDKLGTSGSTIQIDGVGVGNTNSVWLAPGTDTVVTANLELVGNGLTLTDGSSGTPVVFEGAWTGSGNFSFTKAGVTQTFRFLGNMTDYAGNISLSGGQVLEFGNGDVSVNLGIAATSDTGKGTITGTGTTAQVKINYLTDSTSSSTMKGNLALTQNGAQVLTVLGHNTYTGATNINNGSIKLEENGTLGTGTVTLSATNSASLILDGLTISSSNTTTNATISGQGEYGISASGICGTEAQKVTIANATLAVTGKYVLEHVNMSTSTLLTEAGSSATFEDDVTMAALNLESGSGTTFNGAATVSGAVNNSGLITVNDTLTLTGNATTTKNLGQVAGTGTIVADSANGKRVYNLSGDLSGWTGAFEQSAGSGSMTLNVANTSVLNADVINKATTTADCKLDLNLKQAMTVNGALRHESKGELNVTLSGNTTFNNEATLNTLNAASKTVTLGTNGAGDAATHGALSVSGTATIGTLTLNNGSSAALAATSTVGNINLNNGGSLSNSGNLTFTGDFKATGGTLTNTGNLTFGGSAQNVWLTTVAGDGPNVLDFGKVTVVRGTTNLLANGTANDAVINIASLSSSSDKIVQLTNCITDRAHSVVYNLGGADDSAFSGTLRIGIGASATAAGSSMELVLKDKTVAKNAEVNLWATQEKNTNVTLTVGAEEVSVKGITETASLRQTHFTIGGDATETRTLTITGDGDYATSAKVNAHLNLAMKGEGSQTFSGDMSAFDGKLSVSQGAMNIDTDTLRQAKSLSVTGEGSMLALKQGTALSVNEIILGDGAAIITGGEPAAALMTLGEPTPYSDATSAQVTVSGTAGKHALLQATGDTVMSTDLTLGNHVDMVYTNAADGIRLAGHSLTLSAGETTIYLSEEMQVTLENTHHLVLFTGVSDLNIIGLTMNAAEDSDELIITPAGQFFADAQGNALAGEYMLAYNSRTDEVYLAPEPATATLSLLALAALAARRKRR